MTTLHDNIRRSQELSETAVVEAIITLYDKDYFLRGPSRRADLANLFEEAGVPRHQINDYLNEYFAFD